MNGEVLIALDAMGGDHAPRSVVDGAALALASHPELRFLFFGDEARVRPLLSAHSTLNAVSEIRHTSDEVPADEKPSVALRQRRESSMFLAIQAAKEGNAVAAVSSGNTGALMAMAKLSFRTLPGIMRPAIASIFPTLSHPCVLLDMGANAECDAKNLFQFALMGDAFARAAIGKESPSLGLLNIGSEEVKGNSAVKEAADMLRATTLPLNFHGFVEGYDIPAGTVDVVITDGFTGNVVIKTAEGMARLLAHDVKQALSRSFRAKLGYLLARPAIGTIRDKLDPRRYNGAMFLGLNGIAIKSHGSADAESFANAVRVAHHIAVTGVNERICSELQSLGETAGESDATSLANA